jgi:hypothetical protein
MKISLTEMKVTNKENIMSHPYKVGLLCCGVTADKGVVLQHVTRCYTKSCI